LGGDTPAHEDVIYEMVTDPRHDEQAVLALFLSNGWVTETSAGARAPIRLTAARKGSVGRVKAWLDRLVGQTGAAEARDAIRRLATGAHTGIILWDDVIAVLGATASTEVYSASTGTGRVGDAQWGKADNAADVRDAMRHLGTMFSMTLGDAAGLDGAGTDADNHFGLGALGKEAVSKLSADKAAKLFKWVLAQHAMQCEALRTQKDAKVPDLAHTVSLAATIGMAKELERHTAREGAREVLLEERKGDGAEEGQSRKGVPRAELSAAEKTIRNKERAERRAAGRQEKAKLKESAAGKLTATVAKGGAAAKIAPIERKYKAVSAFEAAVRKAEAESGMGCTRGNEPCPWLALFGSCKDGCKRCALKMKPKAGIIDAAKDGLAPDILELVTGSG
jgi:hypothetical protein